MSKIFRKICLALMMVMITGLLTGCSAGSTVDTILNINDDLSGSRVMTLVVDQSVYDEYFTGTVEQLNTVIAEKCPQELTWAYDDSTGVMIYTFTLNFTSPADYKTKVDAIIGEGSNVELTISKADSVWASGVYVKEQFSTSELLEWLKTASVEAEFISSSNSSKLFQLGNHTVVFGGVEYSTYSNMSVDEITYVDINSIDLLTDVSGYDSYNKTIVLSIPQESMNLKGDEIKSWLAGKVPSGAAALWSEDGTDSIYTVTKSDMNAEGLEAFLNEFFGTELCSVVQTDIRENMSPFSFNVGLVETIDFTNYLVGDILYRTDINYYVKGINGYVGGRYLDSLAYYDEGDDISNDYEGYRVGAVSYDNDLLRSFSAYFQKIYRVSDVTIESGLGMLGDLKREIVFTLDGEPTEEEQSVIMEKINALGVAYDEENATEGTSETESETSAEDVKPSWNVDIKDKTKDGIYTLTITQSGSRQEIKDSSKALFGFVGDMYFASDFHFSDLNYGIAIYDRFALGDFVDYTTEDVTSSYVLKTGFGSTITDVNMETGAVIEKNTVTVTDSVLSGVNIIAYGSQFNAWALFFYIFVVVFVLCVIIVLAKLGVFKKLIAVIKAKAAAKENAPVITVEAKDIETIPAKADVTPAVEDRPMFCEHCGAKRDPDALVCTECGTRFED